MKYLFLVLLGCSALAHAADKPEFSNGVQQRLAQIRQLEAAGEPGNPEVPLTKVMGTLESLAKNTTLGSEGEMAVNAAANKAIQRIKARARYLSLNENYRVRLNVLSALDVDDNMPPLGSRVMNLSAEDRKLILSMAFDPHEAVRKRAVNLLWSLFDHDKALSWLEDRAAYSEHVLSAMKQVREKEQNAEIQKIAEDFFDEAEGVVPCHVVLGEN